MAPMLPGMDKGPFDAHLEVDIHADKDNKQGFNPGAWVPYLTVSYQIVKEGSDWSTFGTMMAMSANDGPHYGINVKFNGPGKYRISLKILPPPYNGFFRHTDKETGVPNGGRRSRRAGRSSIPAPATRAAIRAFPPSSRRRRGRSASMRLGSRH